MRRRLMGYAGGLSSVVALAACAAQGGLDAEVAASAPAAAWNASAMPSASPVLTGAAIASMADQYSRPHLGATPAAGASAWVAPAPAPAFVTTAPLPPADRPAPAPAAVANRQPAPPAVAASDIVRPEAAADAPQPAAANPTVRTRGLALFNQFSCSACHAFADAGASGAIGPTLDNPRLTKDAVIAVVTDGRGAMPSFGGQMSAEDIAALADYLVQFSRK